MGIKRFNVWFRNYKKNVIISPPKEIDGLLFDLNSTLHDIKVMVKSETEEEQFKEYTGLFDEIIRNYVKQYNPKKYIIFSVDGVAPAAKMAQQRTRRYKGAHESDALFDGAQITTGTSFMRKLDAYIANFCKDPKNKSFLPEVVIYSSHMDPGEGEHKMFKYLNIAIKKEVIVPDENSKHVVVGLDSDLVMLTMLSPVKNLILLRELKDGTSEYINVEKLKILIKNLMAYEPEQKMYQLIKDFIVMSFFLGNDFIPSFFALYDVNKSMQMMINLYKKIKLPFTDMNGIIWDNLTVFVFELSKKEEELLVERTSASINSQKVHPFNVAINENTQVDMVEIKMHQLITRLEEINVVKEITSAEEIVNMFNWTYAYYTRKRVSNHVFYPYNIGITLTSMYDYLIGNTSFKNILAEPNEEIITPECQLLTIIPPTKSYLIDDSISFLINDLNALAHQSPLRFKYFKDGLEEWEFHPMLPSFNIKKTIDLLKENDRYYPSYANNALFSISKQKNNNLVQQERKRFSVFGQEGDAKQIVKWSSKLM